MADNLLMRHLTFALLLLATACADLRHFAPRENLNGTGPGGYPAAVYPLRADGVAGELRLWSRGAAGEDDATTGAHVVELHLGFELENNGPTPLELTNVSCPELWFGEMRRTDLGPTRIEGSMVAEPHSTARVHTWYRLDGIASARDLDAFTVRFEVTAGGVPVLLQTTPFEVWVARDPRDYDPWFHGRPYGYGFGPGYWGWGLGFGWYCR